MAVWMRLLELLINLYDIAIVGIGNTIGSLIRVDAQTETVNVGILLSHVSRLI